MPESRDRQRGTADFRWIGRVSDHAGEGREECRAGFEREQIGAEGGQGCERVRFLHGQRMAEGAAGFKG